MTSEMRLHLEGNAGFLGFLTLGVFVVAFFMVMRKKRRNKAQRELEVVVSGFPTGEHDGKRRRLITTTPQIHAVSIIEDVWNVWRRFDN